jgi:hypothetical protein
MTNLAVTGKIRATTPPLVDSAPAAETAPAKIFRADLCAAPDELSAPLKDLLACLTRVPDVVNVPDSAIEIIPFAALTAPEGITAPVTRFNADRDNAPDGDNTPTSVLPTRRLIAPEDVIVPATTSEMRLLAAFTAPVGVAEPCIRFDADLTVFPLEFADPASSLNALFVRLPELVNTPASVRKRDLWLVSAPDGETAPLTIFSAVLLIAPVVVTAPAAIFAGLLTSAPADDALPDWILTACLTSTPVDVSVAETFFAACLTTPPLLVIVPDKVSE